ncbi:response regulator transcription factor [Rhodoferax sp.]|uniref:helix-turn-helix transcriptional regulator n=1 Tax=Rhodoferax sp. TaxID=50421 RepID=UPI00374C990A
MPLHYHGETPADFSTLLLRLYRLSQELPIQHFQDAALAQIKQVLPFDSSMWGTATTTASGIDIHTVHLHQKSPEMLQAYEPIKHLDSAAAAVFGKANVTLSVNSQNWFGGAGMGEMRDFLRRFEQENVFITADSNPRTHFVHWISLYRADKDAHGSEAERQLLGQLAPHVMQALALNRVMHLDHLDASDRAMSPYGAAIADARGVIYHADPQFNSLARAEWNDWSGPHLPTELMLDLCRGHERFVGYSIVVRQYMEHGLLFLKARARCLADLLTAREWTIARAIAKGESHKEIAQALNRSPATVRNQIQGIYEKLQVSSIATLIDALRRAE